MFNGSDPCWKPDLPVSRDNEWRLREAKFGDGYSQRTLDGINALNLKYSVTFENRPQDVIVAMVSYLGSLQGKAFPYLDEPVGNVVQVFCDSWHVDWTIKRGTPKTYYGTLSAEFVKANGVTI